MSTAEGGVAERKHRYSLWCSPYRSRETIDLIVWHIFFQKHVSREFSVFKEENRKDNAPLALSSVGSAFSCLFVVTKPAIV